MTILAPLMPHDVDLRDFTFMPVDIVRLFGSDFHAQSSDGAWRAGLTLWLKSFHQVPAGSIPDGDVALARLAEFGRDAAGWGQVKDGALHGWKLCSDGRWYHPVVCEKALEGWIGKLMQRRSGAIGNSKRWGTEPDLGDVDRQIRDAAEALQKLAAGSAILRKCRLAPATVLDPDGVRDAEASHPDRTPMPPRSNTDSDPIAEGSQEKTITNRKGEERESRNRATTPSASSVESRPTAKRGRISKALVPWPPDFALTPDLRDYATRYGFDGDWLFEKFRNKAASKGWAYKDWPAAFRNFAQSEKAFTAAYRSNGAHQDQSWRPPDV